MSKFKFIESDIDIVVNDIIDAIMSFSPKTIFKPMKLNFKICCFIMNLAPVGIADWLTTYPRKVW